MRTGPVQVVGRRRSLVLAASLVVLALAGCSRPGPEQALRQAVGELQQAIEARDASALEDLLSEDFIGDAGMDRDGARRYAALWFLRQSSVRVTAGPLEVELRDDHATVRSTAALTGGSGRLLPDSGQVYQVETGWRLESGEWRMTSARWSPRM